MRRRRGVWHGAYNTDGVHQEFKSTPLRCNRHTADDEAWDHFCAAMDGGDEPPIALEGCDVLQVQWNGMGMEWEWNGMGME